jgi:hypothetical protein
LREQRIVGCFEPRHLAFAEVRLAKVRLIGGTRTGAQTLRADRRSMPEGGE